MPCQALEKRGTGRQLPAGQTLGNDELHERADDDSPQDRRADYATDKRTGRKISTTDAGGGQQQARTDRRERQRRKFLPRFVQFILARL